MATMSKHFTKQIESSREFKDRNMAESKTIFVIEYRTEAPTCVGEPWASVF